MADAISSRIFVKGLPPTLTDAEFRKHFSRNGGDITDAKIFQNRRIGYIGYKTPEDAQNAVKYFNKTFMRMSRIGVEIARPAKVGNEKQGKNAQAARRTSGEKLETIGAKRKRDSEFAKTDDATFTEFMEVMRPKSKKRTWEEEAVGAGTQEQDDAGNERTPEEAESDDEYEQVPKKAKRPGQEAENDSIKCQKESAGQMDEDHNDRGDDGETNEQSREDGGRPNIPASSDADWARSKTSRLLGLLDDEEEAVQPESGDESSEREDETIEKGAAKPASETAMPTPPSEDHDGDTGSKEAISADVEAVRSSMRLFIRNLPYDVKEEDLEAEFASYGNLEEVHVPLDKKSGSAKGFAHLQFTDADSAENALISKDGETFQGRLLHVLPAQAKRENKLNDFDLSKLSLKKQQQIRKRREAGATSFNWNSLYLNQDAVISSVANSLGIAKSDVLDPTSSDAAVRQAHAETHIIQETKEFFQQHGVDLDAFKRSARGDIAILVKNIPYDCSRDELERLFGEHGEIKRFVMPPSGVIAIVEFQNEAQCKAAFGALAYKKLKSSVLFLEKAPKGLFDAKPTAKSQTDGAEGRTKSSASDLKYTTDTTVPDTVGSATLFVRNLNFSTTTDRLSKTFNTLTGFLSARVRTKTDPKKPNQVLSMGFGFVEFRTAADAQNALRAVDGEILEGHKLQVRASHKSGVDAAEDRRRQDKAKKRTAHTTKIIIKNLPFEATKKDVRALFGAYGTLRSVRVPKKMDRGARGFAFADFVTAKEAESAMEALKDTHLLGRRLVLEFVEAEVEDAEAEIERMSKKVGEKVDRVRVQRMVEGGKRKKFRVGDVGGEGEE